jgi:ketosteroid isomerase-like protein
MTDPPASISIRGTPMSLKSHLDAYCTAFNARSLDAAVAVFAEHAVFELPLLGQRLFGSNEIAQGLQRIFELTATVRLDISAAAESDRIQIAEGALHAKLHRDAAAASMPAALTLEAKDGKVTRLSTYLDARPYRLWTDGPIFADAQP